MSVSTNFVWRLFTSTWRQPNNKEPTWRQSRNLEPIRCGPSSPMQRWLKYINQHYEKTTRTKILQQLHKLDIHISDTSIRTDYPKKISIHQKQTFKLANPAVCKSVPMNIHIYKLRTHAQSTLITYAKVR